MKHRDDRAIVCAQSPQPGEARTGDSASDRWFRPPGNLGSWPAIGYLVLLASVLVTGAWKTHPLLSLVLPGTAVVPWLRAFQARRVESWLLCYVGGTYLYTVLRAFADDVGLALQSRYPIVADRLLFGGTVPTEFLQDALFTAHDLDWIDLGATAMHVSFFITPHALLAYIWLRRPSALPLYVGATLLTLYAALVAFFLLPTMPPWLALHTEEMAGTHRVINIVLRGADAGTYRAAYASLAEPNSVAAVPSVHMAITWLVVLAGRELAGRIVWPLVAYAAVMGVSLVYLGEHYVLDLVSGILVASVAYAIARRLARRTFLFTGAGQSLAG